MTNKILIFIDIDGTLIKPNQKPNSKLLPSIIKTMIKKGFLFGLNSNRSFQDILPIYKQFQLNGPTILENGVYFKKNDQSKKIFLAKHPLKLRGITKQALHDFIQKFNIKCKFIFGDTVKLIKSNKLNSIPLAIIANGFREYTGSVHIYQYGKRDTKLAIKLNDFLKNYFAKQKLNMSVEMPKSFGNVVFWPKEINKGKAMKMVKKYYKKYEFIMIGDDLADLETLKEIKYFFAVGNAQDEVKVKADFVANQKYTKGVIEAIKYLMDNKNIL